MSYGLNGKKPIVMGGGFYHLTDDEYGNKNITFEKALENLTSEREKFNKLEEEF